MKVAIIGSRYYCDYDRIAKFISRFRDTDEFVTGDCRGVDSAVFEACKRLGRKCTVFKADWKAFKGMAGPVRNYRMIRSGIDYCVIIVNRRIEECKGSNDVRMCCELWGVKHRIINV